MRFIYFVILYGICLQACAGPRDDVTFVASGLVGVKETGANSGAMVDEILASVGLSPGNPWCAAFNYYCFSRAGLASSVPRTGWSPAWLAGERIQPKYAQKADVFGIYFIKLRRIAHTGIIYEPHDSYFVTIEGNTNDNGSREGDGVYYRKRSKHTLVVKSWIEAEPARN